MRRRLLMQMRSEWRGNLWLFAELLIISLVMWYIMASLYQIYEFYNGRRDFDIDNVYLAEIGYITEGQDGFVPYGEGETGRRDVNLLANHLRGCPYVEMVGAGTNALPFNFSYYGNGYTLIENGDTLNYSGNERSMEPDVIRILRLKGLNGEGPDVLASYLENDMQLISPADEIMSRYIELQNPEPFLGKEIHVNDGVVRIAPVLIRQIRRTEFEPSYTGTILKKLDNASQADELIIRIQPGHDLDFIEWVHSGDMMFGNAYIATLSSLKALRGKANGRYESRIVNLLIIVSSMLVLIFLGFLGTFWFRVQQRIPEIAIRKAMGATRADVLRRLLGESYLLLVISTILAALTAWGVIHSQYFETLFPLMPVESVTIAFIITILMVTLMVLAGIYFPARRAMKINPAIALKDQ